MACIQASPLPICVKPIAPCIIQCKSFQARLPTQHVMITSLVRESRQKLPRTVAVYSMEPPATDRLGWWETDLPQNFTHISTVQELVDELAAGADQLVVVDFFAPWCRACKALFPKFKKLCVEHSDVKFIGVNFDENKGLARSLGVKVLPFFHFYRGAEGRVGAFTASVSKVNRLREAIEDYKSDRCFLEETPAAPLAEFPSVLPGNGLAGKVKNAPIKSEELVA